MDEPGNYAIYVW